MLIMFICALAGISGYLISNTDGYVSAQTRKVKLNETFILQTNETVQTEDGKLTIRLKGVGRTISESGETEYAEFQVWLNKKEQNITISESGDSKKTVGNFVIELVNADSFGKKNCELKITRR